MTLSLFATAATLPGMAAPALEWSRRLGTFAHAMPFLRETANCTSALQCPVGCGCDHEVVQDSDDMLRAVCVCEDSGGCADILVPRAQLRVLQLNVEKVAREIARALNCRPVLASLGVSGLWQAGAWSTAGVPLLLCLTLDGGALSRAIAECAARLDGRFILLVPEPAAANVRARELLRGSALLRLEDVVRPSAPGRFQPYRRNISSRHLRPTFRMGWQAACAPLLPSLKSWIRILR